MKSTTKTIHIIELEDDELWSLRYCLDTLNRTTDPVDGSLSDALDYWLRVLPKSKRGDKDELNRNAQTE